LRKEEPRDVVVRSNPGAHPKRIWLFYHALSLNQVIRVFGDGGSGVFLSGLWRNAEVSGPAQALCPGSGRTSSCLQFAPFTVSGEKLRQTPYGASGCAHSVQALYAGDVRSRSRRSDTGYPDRRADPPQDARLDSLFSAALQHGSHVDLDTTPASPALVL